MSALIEPSPTISFEAFATRLKESESARQRQHALDSIAQLADLSGLRLCCVDTDRGLVIGNDANPSWLPYSLIDKVRHLEFENAEVEVLEEAIAVRSAASTYVAVAYIPTDELLVPLTILDECTRFGWNEEDLRNWWSANEGVELGHAERLLTLAQRVVETEEAGRFRDQEMHELALQYDAAVDEVSLFHFLAQNLQLSRDTFELATSSLSRIRESLRCHGAAVWIAGDSGACQFHCDGKVPFDELELALLLTGFEEHSWPEPLVLNHSVELQYGQGLGLSSLLVVPLQRCEQRAGWVVAINSMDDAGFGSVETGLLQSIAVSLSTHLQNAAVVAEQDELLLSFVRSLVSSLDAKDRYTRGHSERVAMIAKRLGIELGLSDQDVEDIYLAGLLHDVGKIGVDDAILRKPGRLTDEEFDEIKRHPSIGYQILGGIRSLQHILPGVRSHHEAFDGNGYPDGLAGYDIPTMARVLAVADSYDAMGSDRPYRNGMPLEKLEAILGDGRGTQWDADIVDAYFACRDDVREICLDWTARQPS